MSNDTLPIEATNGDGTHADFRAIRAAAHELRTSLTAILGFAELLRMEGSGLHEAERDEMLGFIIANAKAQEGVIDRWLDGTREAADRDGRPTGSSTLGLREETDAFVEQIAPVVGVDRIRVLIPARLQVRADRGAIREVMTNLLINAAKYSPPDSPITVTAVLGAGEATITVRNNGAISSADLEHIFDRGYRAENSDEQEGSGLGLDIVRELVTGFGGRIWAESTNDGTTFNFTVRAAPMWLKAFPLFPLQ